MLLGSGRTTWEDQLRTDVVSISSPSSSTSSPTTGSPSRTTCGCFLEEEEASLESFLRSFEGDGAGYGASAVGEVMACRRPIAVTPVWGEAEASGSVRSERWLSDGRFFFLWWDPELLWWSAWDRHEQLNTNTQSLTQFLGLLTAHYRERSRQMHHDSLRWRQTLLILHLEKCIYHILRTTLATLVWLHHLRSFTGKVAHSLIQDVERSLICLISKHASESNRTI